MFTGNHKSKRLNDKCCTTREFYRSYGSYKTRVNEPKYQNVRVPSLVFHRDILITHIVTRTPGWSRSSDPTTGWHNPHHRRLTGGRGPLRGDTLRSVGCRAPTDRVPTFSRQGSGVTSWFRHKFGVSRDVRIRLQP